METITKSQVMQEITVNAAILRDLFTGASVCAHSKNDLPSLNGVQISAAGGVLSVRATDRYRLITGELTVDDLMLFDTVLISLDDVKRVLTSLKALPKRSYREQLVTITRAGDLLTIVNGSDTFTLAPVDAGFPATSHLYDQELAAVDKIAVSAEFLAAFNKVPTTSSATLTLKFSGDRKPILVDIAHDSITWRGLLMPQRII